ncbi:MAG: hypothetical protein SH809_13185 [Rhodothermales bacterium]|nr:hypothetical protein [Rhodothermales bacterium]
MLLATPAFGQVVVVAHASVPADSISKNELLRLFSGDIEHWADGSPVIVVDLAEKGAVRDSFYAYLGKTSSRMRSVWLKRKLTGEGELPHSIESQEELIDVISQTAGAIGFVSRELTNGHPEIKVLIDSIPMTE